MGPIYLDGAITPVGMTLPGSDFPSLGSGDGAHPIFSDPVGKGKNVPKTLTETAIAPQGKSVRSPLWRGDPPEVQTASRFSP